MKTHAQKLVSCITVLIHMTCQNCRSYQCCDRDWKYPYSLLHFGCRNRVSAFSGLECWTGVLEWSTGIESLEWSEALEWACDHFRVNGYD